MQIDISQLIHLGKIEWKETEMKKSGQVPKGMIRLIDVCTETPHDKF